MRFITVAGGEVAIPADKILLVEDVRGTHCPMTVIRLVGGRRIETTMSVRQITDLLNGEGATCPACLARLKGEER